MCRIFYCSAVGVFFAFLGWLSSWDSVLIHCQPVEDFQGPMLQQPRLCRAPDVLVRSDDGVNLTRNVMDYDNILEVQFLGVFPPFHHRRVCKIKCVNGRWLGPLCSIEEDGGRFQPMLRSCALEKPPLNVLLIHNGKAFWPAPDLQFAHGTSLHARCQTIGLYKFVGNSTIRCRNGHWEKRLPSCLPTTYLTNFTGNVPPSILYRVAAGGAAPSDSGELFVYPGTILHLDCVYRRRDGNPLWSWTPSHRQYPTGWAVTRMERDWKYRLSIYYSRPYDSGVFTCVTPKGITNSIAVVIKAVECPPFAVNVTTTRVIADGFRLNNKVKFECEEGHAMVGEPEATCLWTGKWSADPPDCEVLYCPELQASGDKLQILAPDNRHRGRANFRCPRGHRIDGSSEIICLNGTWSDTVPTCEAVYCQPPAVPEHGRLFGGEKHLVGDKIRYECDPGYSLVGESYIFCVGQGVWDSIVFPSCKPVCDSLKSPENGKLEPMKENYDVGETVTIVCNEEFLIHGAQTLECIGAGNWSHPLPDCKPFIF